MHRLTVQYFAPADPAAFDERYRSTHVPLVHALPGLKSFTLTHPRALGTDAPYLVADLWFEDGDALNAALGSPQMAAAAEDAAKYDVASTTMFSGEVHETLG
ncbi:EthD family reductase [Actinomadura violacea]|uniref:EthD family reductase n=1 Tax=Actinomadura violacea TaxID=2819934 RepID=A0ABS3RM36_9ACTN|nr:EthD family reductase [Actinomadura violacea]MBO2457671.1 EthD family reductase [Actinomadura violacea]